MSIWLALILPLIGAFVMYKYFRTKLTWWEMVIPMLVAIVFIFIFKFCVQTSQITDTEYHGSLLVRARYTEYWETWVVKTCSYECNCTTDKNNHRSCQTCYRDCSECEEHGPRWYAYNSLGEEFSITESYYKYLKKLWNSSEVFVELNRKIKYHDGIFEKCGKDGDAYDITWNQDPMTSISTTTEHNYENKVQATHSAFDFVKVTKEDKKIYALFEYPKVTGFIQNNVLGLDSLSWLHDEEKEKLTRMGQYLNGKLGPEKHARLYWLFFVDKPEIAALMQEAYWDGGNDNELVICIGLSKTTRNMQWVKPFSWTPARRILVDMREDLMSFPRFNADSITSITQRNVLSEWKRKDFKEFSYLSVDIPGWAKLTIWILTAIITGLICWWGVSNDYVADPKNSLKTIIE